MRSSRDGAGATGARGHAVVVGIDDYPEKPLKGCVADARAVADWLRTSGVVEANELRLLLAPRRAGEGAKRPTRAALLAELDRLAKDSVSVGDHVWIHFAGHGRSDRVRRGNRTGHRESIVVLGEDGDASPIYDYELAPRLAAIARRARAVIVTLDSCFSAGSTRGRRDRGSVGDDETIRSLPGQTIDEASLPEPVAGATRGFRAVQAASPSGLVVLAACREDEEAGERRMGRTFRGVFTVALLEVLDAMGRDGLANATWDSCWPSIVEHVRALRDRQTPWPIGDLTRPVLGGEPRRRPPGFGVRGLDGEYEVAAGTALDVTRGARIAVYAGGTAPLPPLGSKADRAARLGTLVVTEEGAWRSRARAEGRLPPIPAEARGRILAAGQARALAVHLDPELAERVRLPARFRKVEDPAQAEVRLQRSRDGSEIVLADDALEPPRGYAEASIPSDAPDRAERARVLLDRYAEYRRPLRMAQLARALPGALHIAVLDCNDLPTQRRSAPHPSQFEEVGQEDGVWTVRLGDRYCFRIDNAGPEVLSVSLLECGINGVVLFHGDVMLPAGSSHLFWCEEQIRRAFVAGPPAGLSRLVAIGIPDRTVSLRELAIEESFNGGRAGGGYRLSTRGCSLADPWVGTVAGLDAI